MGLSLIEKHVTPKGRRNHPAEISGDPASLEKLRDALNELLSKPLVESRYGVPYKPHGDSGVTILGQQSATVRIVLGEEEIVVRAWENILA